MCVAPCRRICTRAHAWMRHRSTVIPSCRLRTAPARSAVNMSSSMVGPEKSFALQRDEEEASRRRDAAAKMPVNTSAGAPQAVVRFACRVCAAYRVRADARTYARVVTRIVRRGGLCLARGVRPSAGRSAAVQIQTRRGNRAAGVGAGAWGAKSVRVWICVMRACVSVHARACACMPVNAREMARARSRELHLPEAHAHARPVRIGRERCGGGDKLLRLWALQWIERKVQWHYTPRSWHVSAQ